MLDEARFSQKTDAINRRINAVYFWGLGLTQRQISRLAHVSANTMRRYVDVFETNGLAAMTMDDRHGRPSVLAPYEEVIRDEFIARPPATVNQAKARIAEITGIKLENTRVRHYMQSLGMKQRQLTRIPGKADPSQQEDFKKTFWNRCWTRPEPANATSTSSTPLTLFMAHS
jgi:transposase